MTSELITLTECIGRHLRNIERDGLANSKAHVELIDQDARTMHAILIEAPYTIPLHIRET